MPLQEAGSQYELFRELPRTVEDGRMSMQEIFDRIERGLRERGWGADLIYTNEFEQPEGEDGESRIVKVPILAYRTGTVSRVAEAMDDDPAKRQAIFSIGGIHGEEPAGPEAIARQVDVFQRMADRGIPMVVVPFAHGGYARDWRYPNMQRDGGISIGSSDHYLPDETGRKPRADQPESAQAGAFTAGMLDLAKRYNPRLVVDHHEDWDVGDDVPPGFFYLYSQGERGRNDPRVNVLVKRLKGIKDKLGIVMGINAETSESEQIIDGIIDTSEAKDSSLDELLGAKYRYDKKKGIWVKGPNAETVIVAETDMREGQPLQKRVAVHQEVINALQDLWNTPFRKKKGRSRR